MTNILHLNSSGRVKGSASRELSAELVARLAEKHNATVTIREVTTDLQFPTDAWIEGNFTPDSARTSEQEEALSYSARLVEELKSADIIVIASPIYNFSISGALKAWIDQVCRPGLTFQPTEDGFTGLLGCQKAYLVMSSGGTEVKGPIDFATDYLIYILGFLGVTDVDVISADTMMTDPEAALAKGHAQIDALMSDKKIDDFEDFKIAAIS